MSNSSPNLLQREQRYVLRQRPKVTVRPGRLLDKSKGYSAELCDLSQSGAKLISSKPIATQKSLRVELDVEELGLRFHVAAEVCWSKPGEAGTWMFGCSLNPGLPEGLFDTLASGEHVDRRLDPRQDHALTLEAIWDLNGRAMPIILRDYSNGGFCICAREPGQIGERCHLRLTAPYDRIIPATAVWQLKVVDGFLIGCSFLNEQDFDHLKQFGKLSTEIAPV
jgi:hypothetical protein